MAATRIKVELKKKYNDKERNFKDMFQEFKRQVSDAGIMHELKERQYFETKSEKQRKKKRAVINKNRQERLEKKILAGERVKAPSGLIKKILDKHKKDNKKEDKKEQRRGSYGKK